MNAYISFMQIDSEGDTQKPASSEADAETPTHDNTHPDNGDPNTTVGRSERAEVHSDPGQEAGLALICISGGGEFEAVRTWCDTVTKV